MAQPLIYFVGTNDSGDTVLFGSRDTQGSTAAVAGAAPYNPFAFSYTVRGSTVFTSEVGSDGNNDLFTTNLTGGNPTQIQVAGSSSSGLNPTDFVNLTGEVLFAGTDSNDFIDLWAASGTTFQPLTVTNASSEGLTPSDLTVFNTSVLFNGLDADFNSGLWTTDGTAAHTHEITAQGANEFGISPIDITSVGSVALFAGTDVNGLGDLWRTDGTNAGTVDLKVGSTSAPLFGGFAIAPQFAVLNGNAVFVAEGANGMAGVWVTTETAGSKLITGAAELTITGANATAFNPTDLTTVGSEVLFSGSDTNGLDSLWETDGTAKGTKELTIAGASPNGLNPTDITAAGNDAFFGGIDANGQNGLWLFNVLSGTSTELLAGVIAGGVSPTEIAALPCFAAGTLIDTPDGEMEVESLVEGGRVLAADGTPREIRWVGNRQTLCSRHPTPEAVWPVRVIAGAFAAGKPSRDLLLSPDHAVFTEGVLIPIRYLINGRTVRQEAVEAITYYHVELPRHAVILAEGLPVESFLDTGNREAFANGGRIVSIHPDFSARIWEAEGCAPLVVAGPLTNIVRTALQARCIHLHGIPGKPHRRQMTGPTRRRVNTAG